MEAIHTAAIARQVELPEVYFGQLQGVSRQLSFSIAGLSGLDQIPAVKDSFDQAMQNGMSFGEWRNNPPIWCHGAGEDFLNLVNAGLDGDKPMPEPRQSGIQLLPHGQNERFHLEAFMQEFNAAWNDDVRLITFQIDDRQVLDALQQLQRRTANLQPVMDDIGQSIVWLISQHLGRGETPLGRFVRAAPIPPGRAPQRHPPIQSSFLPNKLHRRMRSAHPADPPIP